jgi:DNA-binding LacI/PurR family transcriptional regulator
MRRFQKPTIRDVAKKAGVSITTVSHVVSGVASACSVETAARVRAAITELQYTPNSLSRSLHQKGTGIIGVGVQPPGIQARGVFAEQVWIGISEAADELGISLLQFPTKIRDAADCNAFLSGQIDGLILSASSHNTRLDQLYKAGMPTVAVTRSRNIPEGIGAVYANELDTIRLLIAHLVSLGHTQIAHVCGPIEDHKLNHTIHQQSDIALMRRTAFDAQMQEHFGVPPLIAAGKDWTHEDDSLEILRDWMSLLKPPTALLCANDQIAWSMIAAAETLGLRVPKDISVVGVDHSAPSHSGQQRLTTVAIPAFDIGYASLYCLERLRAGATMTDCTVVLPVVDLILGESSAPPSLQKNTH